MPELPEAINLATKFAAFTECWSPKLAGQVNGAAIKLVKVQGEFVWHHHEQKDELFLVVRGSLTMRFREREVVVRESEFIIVPRGVEHQPAADEEA